MTDTISKSFLAIILAMALFLLVFSPTVAAAIGQGNGHCKANGAGHALAKGQGHLKPHGCGDEGGGEEPPPQF